MKYKFILVEGLPGTGKTTLAKQIHKNLTERGIQSVLLLEGNRDNPCNFYNMAGIPRNDFAGFVADVTILRDTENYVFVNIETCERDIANKLLRFDIGDEFNKFISAQEYARCTLEWWQSWADTSPKGGVIILDSAFLQCPINEMLFRGASDSEVKVYIEAIAGIIKPLSPVCIYLRRENPKAAIDFAKAAKGESWAKGIDELADMGFPDFFERRLRLESAALSSVPAIVCDVYGYDWSDANEKMRDLFF